MKLLLLLVVATSVAEAGSIYVVNTSGKSACWPAKGYDEMKKVIKKREPKRACQENAAAKRFDCMGAGFGPSAYMYFESKTACERHKLSHDDTQEE
jgi:hypothetical protein